MRVVVSSLATLFVAGAHVVPTEQKHGNNYNDIQHNAHRMIREMRLADKEACTDDTVYLVHNSGHEVATAIHIVVAQKAHGRYFAVSGPSFVASDTTSDTEELISLIRETGRFAVKTVYASSSSAAVGSTNGSSS